MLGGTGGEDGENPLNIAYRRAAALIIITAPSIYGDAFFFTSTWTVSKVSLITFFLNLSNTKHHLYYVLPF